MTVLIKGMNMPKRTNSIIFETRNGTLMCRNLDILDDDWYEVVEIPMPHGRLIDADELEALCNYPNWSVNKKIISERPTVIESEK